MTLTREEVEHIADLARLGLTEDEKDTLRTQLSAILDYFQVLQQLDTDSVQPTTTAIPSQNVMREDIVEPCMPRDDVLANASDTVDGYVRVRAVLE
jgi:aspartyl-tRNA(Asn)/glutamyl-tRNA(Gln) amidotransferase subunit C